ncbi:MAG: Flagellin [Holosporales bacterium]
MRINTNVSSLNAQNQLAKLTKAQNLTYKHLNEGKRISSASDDAASFGIANSMRVQVNSYNQAAQNGKDGIGMIQTADSATGQVYDMIARARVLAMQSANGPLQDSDRANIAVEFNLLANEVDRIQNNTEYNGQKIISSETANSINFQVGITGDESSFITVEFNGLDMSAFSAAEGQDSALSISTQTDAQSALATLDDLIQQLSTYRANLGATSNRLDNAVDSVTALSTSLSSALSQIVDADIAKESADMAKNDVLMQAGIAVLSQINQAPQMALKLLQ